MLDLNYTPEVVVDTATQTREEWEKQRNIGIGGSEGAAILGKSKFQTNIDVYYRKIGEPKKAVDDIQQFLFDCGHAMEPMVARAFQIHHPDWKVETDTIMYRHPKFPYMIADVDFVAIKPDGEKVIVECKFVTHESADTWRESPPEYYQIQCRHYLSVLNLKKAYLCALWGNNPQNDYVEWPVSRDLDFEEEYISKLARFWDCVKAKTEPKLSGGYAQNILKMVKERYPVTDPDATIALEADDTLVDDIDSYLNKKAKIKACETKIKELEQELSAAQARIIIALDGASHGVVTTSYGKYNIYNNPSKKNVVDIDKLKTDYPEVYKSVAKTVVTNGDLKAASSVAYKNCVVSTTTDNTKFSIKFHD